MKVKVLSMGHTWRRKILLSSLIQANKETGQLMSHIKNGITSIHKIYHIALSNLTSMANHLREQTNDNQ